MALLQKLRGGAFSAMLMTGGAAAASQLVVLATIPVATRLFGEEAFGILGLFVAFSNILTIIAHFGLTDAIIASNDDDEADALLLAAFVATGVMAVPIGVIMYGLMALDVFGAGALPWWVAPAVSVQVVCVSLVMALQMRAVRHQSYKALAGSHLALGLSRGSGQVGFGLLRLGPVGLIASEVGSRFFTALVLWRTSKGLPRLSRASLGLAARAAHSYRRFMAYRTPATLAGVIKVSFPPLLVSAFYPITEVGYFTLTTAVLFAPIGLLQKAIGDVFTGNYAALHRKDNSAATRLLRRTSFALFGIGAVMALVLTVAGPAIFAFVFGAPWRPSGEIAATLAPALVLMIMAAPISPVINVLGRPELLLYVNAIALAVFAGLYGFLQISPQIGFDGAILAVTLVMLATNAALFALVHYTDRTTQPVRQND